MKTILLHLFTGRDNATADLARVLWAWAVLAFTGLSGWEYGWHGQAFDPVAWATAMGALLVAGAGGVWAKRATEPGQ